MKKIIFTLIILSLFTASQTFAQTPSVTPSPTPAIIQYQLAYPGILPDSPLYFLKKLWIKFQENRISDTNQKIDFYALQADKMILAASILQEKHEVQLAKDTSLKGENNITNLVNVYKSTRTMPNEQELRKLQLASMKHQEVLQVMIDRASQSDKKTFEDVLYFSKQNLKELQSLTTKKQ